MKHLGLARKNKEVNADSWELLYSTMIEKKVRKKYTINNEIAILRQRDTKPAEYQAYFEYVEKCKAEVKEEMGVD